VPLFSRRKTRVKAAELPSASPVTFPSLGQPWEWDGRVIVPDPGLPLVGYQPDPYGVWESQPSVRKVVDFIARNIASIPWHVYRRRGDTDRERVTDHPLARLLSRPGVEMTSTRLWHSVLVDYLLWDRWCVHVLPSADTASGYELLRIPAHRMRLHTDLHGRVDQVIVYTLDGEGQADPPRGYLFDHGYAAEGAEGTSPLLTIRNLLAESDEAVEYRRGVWKNQARVPAVLERPADAPDWSPEARSRFKEAWRRFIKGGGEEGGTPILEDGMKLAKVDAFAPRDTNDLEGRKLTDQEVASAYHIAPELVGAREGTFSNIDAFRQMLYRDALGPHITAFEQVLNAMLVPLFAAGDPDLYVEAHVESKLKGSFIEQAQYLQSSVGAPWLTRNEARARANLPAVEDGDELVTPLNVTTGGLASPRDTAPAPGAADGKAVAVKSRPADLAPADRERSALADSLGAHLHATVGLLRKRLDEPSDPVAVFTGDYDQGVAHTIAGRAKRIAESGAWRVLERFNPDADGWSDSAMDGWIGKAAVSHATDIRRSLQKALGKAGTSGRPWAEARDAELDRWARRAETWAAGVALEAVSFGGHDAAKATGLGGKTWHAGDERHADLDGVSLGVDELFPGNLRWPGDPIAAAGQTAGCRCTVTYSRSEP
jgi:HK97 family phage portal protein